MGQLDQPLFHLIALGLISPTSRSPSLSAFQHRAFTSNDKHISGNTRLEQNNTGSSSGGPVVG